MNNQNLLALMVWAIDRDLLKVPVQKAWELFVKDAVGCQKIYTDPTDELLYSQHVVSMTPIEFFTDYVLFYAKPAALESKDYYGTYTHEILNYKKQL